MTIPSCFGLYNKLTPNGQAEQDCYTCPALTRCSAIPKLPLIRVEAEGEANFFRFMDTRTGEWVASLQLNGEMTSHRQNELLNRMAEAYNTHVKGNPT